ncbi:MAG: prepilin-type N-terminal cleavage/methylation domain-containing protein [Planctomycetota bacterium]|nr:prepilin-type N-terminal cleavage/methylation domain-containing protein [Planctomycetota bacterium]
MKSRPLSRAGFTLAEVAVTIVIVGIGLVLVLQGLNTAKITAAQTRNEKLARELGLYTLGQIESGLYQEDIEQGLAGTYADQGYAAFTYEVVVGDEGFVDTDPNAPFDSWKPRTQKQLDDEKKKDEEQLPEPYEKVKIKVSFPKFAEYQNQLVLEHWMPWTQVYGETDEDGNKKTSSSTTPP